MNRAEKRRQQKLAKKAGKKNRNAGHAPDTPPQTADISSTLNLAVQHHNAGRLAEAGEHYRQVLQSAPDHPDALHLLGVICLQKDALQDAIDLISKAVTLKPGFPEAHSNLGGAHRKAGNLEQAVTCYQRAIALNPEYADAHFNLGNTNKQLGRLNDAVENYRQALKINPDFVLAYNNLGNTFMDRGEPEDALFHFRKAVDLKPDYTAAQNNLGNALFELGQLEEAENCLQQVLRAAPHMAEAHNNLGNVLNARGQPDQARACFEQAVALNPDDAEAYNNLGTVLDETGRMEEAIICYQKALAIKSDFAEAHNNLGQALLSVGELEAARDAILQALALRPDFIAALNTLGSTLQRMGKPDEAERQFREAIRINPRYTEAYNNLGNVLQDMGRVDETVACYREALAIKPDDAEIHSNLLLSEQYRSGHSAESLYRLHRQWDQRHGQPLREHWPAHQNARDPERRLRIGFVSPDMKAHPVGYFIAGLLKHLPKDDTETICYFDGLADEMTERLRADTDEWRAVRGLPDPVLAEKILDDQIDILIDLTGHSANNRLPVFARKPAPVQVTWAGYVGTTGLSSIDYLITDIHSTPKEEEQYYSEKVARLPDGWLCYSPPLYAPDVNPSPPCQRTGSVTFGAFCNPAKINSDVIGVWAEILKATPDSRLLIIYKGIDSKANIDRITHVFESHAVDRSRLLLEGQTPHRELLDRYNAVDIALDTFPYSGGLTTYEALWMGVPVLSLYGETFASRHSLSHLATVNLPELAVNNTEDYVALATEWANSPEKLENLRKNLRDKMRKSPICDYTKYAESYCELLRDMWRQWCQSH